MVPYSFVDYILEDVLRGIEGITSRRMFGAVALYKEGIIFAIVSGEQLYFKADPFTDFYFTEKGSEQFSYESAGRTVRLPYWELPPDVLENKEELLVWIERSASVAEQGAKRQARLVKTRAKQEAQASAATEGRRLNDVRAVLFDCFGLFFSPVHEDWLTLHAPDFTSRRKEYEAIEERGDRGDIPYGEFIAEVAKMFKVSPVEMQNGVLKLARVNVDLLKVLQLLRPRYRVGLVTNSSKDFIDRLFARFDLAKEFDSVTASSSLHCLKPNKKIFMASVASLGVRPQNTIYIDDKVSVVEKAMDSGFCKGIVFMNVQDCISELHNAGVIFR